MADGMRYVGTLGLVLLLAGGCGTSGGPPGTAAAGFGSFLPVVPMSSTQATTFLILGVGFPPSNEPVAVRFDAAAGTPFLGGTAATLDTTAIVETDGQIRGMAPPAQIPSNTPGPVPASVTVTFPGGRVYASPGLVASFEALPPPPPPTVTGMTPGLLLSGTHKCFQIRGTRFGPIGGTATVDFTAAAGTPFPGPSDTLTVVAAIDTASQISGSLPAMSTAAAAEAFVTVHFPGGDSAMSIPAIAKFDLERKVTAGDGTGFDFFGNDVAIDGDTAVVGARLEDETGSQAGAAYVFMRTGTTWTEQAKLRGLDGAGDDQFGTAVAISGTTIVIGAPNHDAAASNGGAAYVFVRSGSVWSLQQKLTAMDATTGDHFGEDVAIDGSLIAVGAADENNAGGTDAGSVYVFSRAGTTWSEDQKITASDGSTSARFGMAVSLSGDALVVGAPGADRAYAYRFAGGAWASEQALTAPGVSAGDAYGTSVDVSGDLAVVGASAGDGIVGGSGVVHAFARSAATWSHEAALGGAGLAAGADFGHSVAIDGQIVLAGAPEADASATNGGAVFSFERTSPGTWSPAGPFFASDLAANDRFGFAVDTNGCAAIIGSYLDNDLGIDSGSAYFK